MPALRQRPHAPQDWKSGDKLWIVEVLAPFGGTDEMLKGLKAKVFKDREVRFRVVEGEGRGEGDVMTAFRPMAIRAVKDTKVRAMLLRAVAGSAVLALSVLLGLWAYGFFKSAIFHRQLAYMISSNREVRLADLVNFEPDVVFILPAYAIYDLAPHKRMELLGTDRVNVIPWRDNHRYWTIGYRRLGETPFIVKIDSEQWDLHGRSFLWSTEKNAKLRVVTSPTLGADGCRIRYGPCLILEDSRTNYAK